MEYYDNDNSVVEQEEYKDYTIQLRVDEYPDSPYDEGYYIGHVFAFHRRYNVGEKHHYGSEWASLDDILADVEKERRVALVLPLYGYDHSMFVMSTKSFVGRAHHASWDSGTLGFVVAYRDEVLEAYGVKRITKKVLDQLAKGIETELEEYSDYINGAVYIRSILDPDGNEIEDETVSNVIGYENALSEGREIIDSIIRHNDKQTA